jgi:hypothetical protein
MLRLMKLHEEGREFLIRCCMFVGDGDFVTVGSVVRQCEECGRDVWYATNQVAPIVPGKVFEGEVLLCLPCVLLHQAFDNEDPQWIGPTPWDL